MGSSTRAMLRSRDMLPPSVGEESMVSARDELGPILQKDKIRRLDGGPMRLDAGLDVPAVVPAPDGSVDLVAGTNVGQRLRAAISHQDGRVTTHAVGTSMTAAPIRVDRETEGHTRRLGNVVDDRPRVDLVEREAAKLRRVERADHGPLLEQRGRQSVVRRPNVESEVVPAHRDP
jgi:hypothetical protein